MTPSSGAEVDVLMITHRRPHYSRLSLQRLLETCDESARVWLWQNGSHEETLEVARSFSDHPRVHAFHHSVENVRLRAPTNWLWRESDAPFVAKVDDDCLVPDGWLSAFRKTLSENPSVGGVACWHFPEEDFSEERSRPKLRQLQGGVRLLHNMWLPGSGYVLRRACIDECGLLDEGQPFTDYCIGASLRGWMLGWHVPLYCQDHMDDPRSPHTFLRNDQDLERWPPLSASRGRVRTLAEWEAQLRRSAALLQTASVDPRDYVGWRDAVRRIRARVRRFVTRNLK